MFTTPNMGLTAWDLGTDNYDHAQLAQNFSQLDDHDHTLNKGKQIPTDGIQNSAITTAKLAGDSVIPTSHIPVDSIPQSRLAIDSVGTPELQDNSVGTTQIIDGSVIASKLDPSIIPVGMVVMWYRADSAVLPPSGWEVLDGRPWSTVVNKLGAGGTQWSTGNMPNMANKFPLGAALAGTGNTPSDPPAIGATGGQHERDLSHTHTTNPHNHLVDSHAHGISLDGSHSHRFWANTPSGSSLRDIYSRDVGVPKAEGTRQALYVQQHNQSSFAGSDVVLPMETVSHHSHGGLTGFSTASTDQTTVSVNTGLTGNQDLRPAHVGFLFIMKVR